LRLYVAGTTQKSVTALANLKRICEEHLKGKYRIEVVDLLKNRCLRAATRSLRYPPWYASCHAVEEDYWGSLERSAGAGWSRHSSGR